MSIEHTNAFIVEMQGEPQIDGISKAEEDPPVIIDHREKEFLVSPVELDGPTISRHRHFSETSTTIAPQVVGTTNISGGTVTHANPDSTDGRAELETEKTEPERHTGLVLRGIGTRWHRLSKRRRFAILMIAASIIIATILLASLLGVFFSRHHSNDPPATDAFAILPNSQLAALTFQSVNDLTDKSVFFQLTSSHALMRARCNATTNQQWVFENVSQSMIDGGSAIFPKAGTPIVAVAPDMVDAGDLSNFWIDVYFMSASNVPFQIWSWSTPQTDPSKDLLWHQEGLQNYQVIFTTGFAAGTQLAAYRDQCADGCSNNSKLLYQGANRDLMIADSTVVDWMDWNVTDLSDDLAGRPQLPQLEMNSSIAVTRFSPSTGEDPVGMRMYYDVSHQLEEYLLINGTWTNGSLQASLGDQSTPPQIAAVAFTNDTNDTSLDRTLLTVLFDNGTIAVHWQEPAATMWNVGFAPPTNVSALAVNFGLQAYCLIEGRIQEWQIDRFTPTDWTLIGNVTSTLE
ncbi:hypothetical protein N0V93_005970 [Gnomoniopsis smithogilvyi]|uniref:Fucose-specific lectin n=1 Tax=Gnomoniopsis smithogilvyi TaxID=1191159 RepID=A0A9W9CYI7_9PEZI|nr:hypothetical protein N0V93_005970 [Gnomoniopsis smithogilvyi]